MIKNILFIFMVISPIYMGQSLNKYETYVRYPVGRELNENFGAKKIRVGGKLLSVKKDFCYLMVSHARDSVQEYENLYIAKSEDGVSWRYIEKDGNKFVYQDPEPNNNIRDPDIVYYNGNFFVCYTSGIYGKKKSIRVIRSKDLLNWSFFLDIPSNDSAYYSWSPQWFEDSDKSLSIILTLELGETDPYIDFKGWELYYMTPLFNNLKAWSKPARIKSIGGVFLTTNRIDGVMINVNSLYYLFYAKRYFVPSRNNQVDYTTSRIDYKTGFDSSKTVGNWGTFMEAPSIVEILPGKFRLYLDHYNKTAGDTLSIGIYYTETNDFVSWSGLRPISGLVPQPKHPTVLRVNKSTSRALR